MDAIGTPWTQRAYRAIVRLLTSDDGTRGDAGVVSRAVSTDSRTSRCADISSPGSWTPILLVDVQLISSSTGQTRGTTPLPATASASR